MTAAHAFADLEEAPLFHVELPFPPAALSGHAKGHWRGKSAVTKKHRAWAYTAAKACRYAPPLTGDITVYVVFYPPDKRGDRVNFPNRMKPYFDGIAEALGVNDSRFLPHFQFRAPEKPGCVKVMIGGARPEPVGAAARRAVLAIIDRETDPSERKAKILLARETGHITDEEVEEWLVLAGLEGA